MAESFVADKKIFWKCVVAKYKRLELLIWVSTVIVRCNKLMERAFVSLENDSLISMSDMSLSVWPWWCSHLLQGRFGQCRDALLGQRLSDALICPRRGWWLLCTTTTAPEVFVHHQRLRGYFYNEMRYINLLFTYLLTYIVYYAEEVIRYLTICLW